MKKHLIFIILSLNFLLPLSTNAVKKIEANPINVAAVLVEKTDSTDIASTCEYYGYVRQSTENNYTVYKHPLNGSKIRYKLREADSNQRLATVEVKSKVGNKETERILNELNFKSKDNSYERQAFGYTTKCSLDSHGYLIFSQNKKIKKESK